MAIKRQARTRCRHVTQDVAELPATALSLEQATEIPADSRVIRLPRYLEDAKQGLPFSIPRTEERHGKLEGRVNPGQNS